MEISKISMIINNTYDNELIPDPETESYIHKTIELLDKGKIRVAQNLNGQWTVNDWIKKGKWTRIL
jgi:2,3,4,5-tetrahydropyridine-2-carboxylate N-succinyltransferase